MKHTNKTTRTKNTAHSSLPYLLATLGIITLSGALGWCQDATPRERKQIAQSYQATAQGAAQVSRSVHQAGRYAARLLGLVRR